MRRMQIQFHAERGELISLALDWARDFGLIPVLEQFFPDYRISAVVSDERSDVAGDLANVDRVALCSTDPDLTAVAAHEFVTRNPNCLFVSIGSRDADGLRESALGGDCDDPETLRRWRDLIRYAKSAMHQGATISNPVSGVREPRPGHLHTAGAHQLAASGVKMLAAAGWNQFVFDDCVA